MHAVCSRAHFFARIFWMQMLPLTIIRLFAMYGNDGTCECGWRRTEVAYNTKWFSSNFFTSMHALEEQFMCIQYSFNDHSISGYYAWTQVSMYGFERYCNEEHILGMSLSKHCRKKFEHVRIEATEIYMRCVCMHIGIAEVCKLVNYSHFM